MPVYQICTYDVAWCVKYKMPLLTEAIMARFKELCREPALSGLCEMRQVRSTRHYVVRMRVIMSPRDSVHRVIKRIKAETSPVLRREFSDLRTKLPALWTNSFHACTVSTPIKASIEAYIASEPFRGPS